MFEGQWIRLFMADTQGATGEQWVRRDSSTRGDMLKEEEARMSQETAQ